MTQGQMWALVHEIITGHGTHLGDLVSEALAARIQAGIQVLEPYLGTSTQGYVPDVATEIQHLSARLGSCLDDIALALRGRSLVAMRNVEININKEPSDGAG